MTKTSEELTEDWLNNKLQAGSFWFVETEDSNPEPMVVDMDGDFDDYNGNYYWPCFSKGKLKVLAPVPTYDEYKAMQEQIADASKKVEELEDEIAELEKENKQLEKDIDYGWHAAGIESDKNDELRGLLKECLAHLSLGEIGTSVIPINILIDRINAALGESEER